MQPCKTGDQLHSDASPYGECSLPEFVDNDAHLSCTQCDQIGRLIGLCASF